MDKHDLADARPTPDAAGNIPRPRRPVPQATGTISSSLERATAVIGWNNAPEVSKVKAWIELVDRVEAERLDFRNPDYARERQAIKAAALEVCQIVGLARHSLFYGHRLRRVVSEIIRRSRGEKKATSASFTCVNIEAALLQRDFQERARELLQHPELWDEGSARQEVDDRATQRALMWVESGMHFTYLNALRIIKMLGGTVRGEQKTLLSLDHALQMAWRRRKG